MRLTTLEVAAHTLVAKKRLPIYLIAATVSAFTRLSGCRRITHSPSVFPFVDRLLQGRHQADWQTRGTLLRQGHRANDETVGGGGAHLHPARAQADPTRQRRVCAMHTFVMMLLLGSGSSRSETTP